MTRLVKFVDTIRKGDLIIFPTDTVFAIACDPFNENAVEKLYTAKKRSRGKGIPILAASAKDALTIARLPRYKQMRTQVLDLIKKYWPGPLTLVLPSKTKLARNISPNENIAVRVPKSKIALEIIKKCGGVLAATSANISGKKPIKSALKSEKVFPDVLCFGELSSAPGRAVPSVIIDCANDRIRIIRKGKVAGEILKMIN